MCQQELGGSAPGVSGSDASTTPPYAAGQQAQQQQQDREEKEKLKKMKEKKKKDSVKKKKKYSAEEIIEYIDVLYRVNSSGALNMQIGIIDEDPEVLKAWKETLKKAGYNGDQDTELGNEVYRALNRGNLSHIYKQPEIADSSTSSTDSIDGLITDSDNFINKGSNDRINDKSIQDFSKTLYNILITIATVVSVIIGGILGIKIMLASAEEKAQVKELLVPYVIGCVVVFGAFGIWKLVVNILQNI